MMSHPNKLIAFAMLFIAFTTEASEQTLLETNFFESVIANADKPHKYLHAHKALHQAGRIMGVDIESLGIEPPNMVRISRRDFTTHFSRYKSYLGERTNYIYIPAYSTIVVLEPPVEYGKAHYAELLHEMTHHIQQHTLYLSGNGCISHAEEEASAVSASYLAFSVTPQMPSKCRVHTKANIASSTPLELVF